MNLDKSDGESCLMFVEKRANGQAEPFDASSQSMPPIETVVEQDRVKTEMARTSPAQVDSTKVPNWVFPILATVLFALLGFVYVTVKAQMDDNRAMLQKQIDEMNQRVQQEETWRAR